MKQTIWKSLFLFCSFVMHYHTITVTTHEVSALLTKFDALNDTGVGLDNLDEVATWFLVEVEHSDCVVNKTTHV